MWALLQIKKIAYYCRHWQGVGHIMESQKNNEYDVSSDPASHSL